MRDLIYALFQSTHHSWVGIDGVLVEGRWEVCAYVEVTILRDALMLRNLVVVRGETKACAVVIQDSLRAGGLEVIESEELSGVPLSNYFPHQHRMSPRQDPDEVGRIIKQAVRDQPRIPHAYLADVHMRMGHLAYAYGRLHHLILLARSVKEPGARRSPFRGRELESLLHPFGVDGVTTKALGLLRTVCSVHFATNEVLESLQSGGSVIRSWEG